MRHFFITAQGAQGARTPLLLGNRYGLATGRNRSAGATSISSFPLLMEPIVVAVGCGAAGAASDLKINPPRLIKKGLWEQYARVLRQRRAWGRR
jgi:hypothetical protein